MRRSPCWVQDRIRNARELSWLDKSRGQDVVGCDRYRHSISRCGPASTRANSGKSQPSGFCRSWPLCIVICRLGCRGVRNSSSDRPYKLMDLPPERPLQAARGIRSPCLQLCTNCRPRRSQGLPRYCPRAQQPPPFRQGLARPGSSPPRSFGT